MKFEFIGKYDRPVNSYLGTQVVSGDVVDLPPYLAEKAKNNPNYRQIKRGRKPKNGDES